jgi:hypothetical protein
MLFTLLPRVQEEHRDQQAHKGRQVNKALRANRGRQVLQVLLGQQEHRVLWERPDHKGRQDRVVDLIVGIRMAMEIKMPVKM